MRAPVAELADAPALGAGVLGRVGSSPTRRTTHLQLATRSTVPYLVKPVTHRCGE